MIVLSLFDGCSGGQAALRKAGIPYSLYMASEIDRYAMQVTRNNFPGTIFCGDITKLKVDKLPFAPDLIIGGSPCQGFSFAGKQLNFQDPGSKLFFEYVRILNEVREKNPDVLFMLENVVMKKVFKDAISIALRAGSVQIDAALVSAQTRKRLYWCNWSVPQPDDRGIVLRDILETEVPEQYYHTQSALDYMNREVSGGRNHWDFKHHHDSGEEKAQTLPHVLYKGVPYNVLMDRMVEITGAAILNTKNNSGQLTLDSGTTLIPHGTKLRRLTPVEAERLQGLPDNYTAGVSDTQRYKMLGNGWQIDAVVHIFSHMPKVK